MYRSACAAFLLVATLGCGGSGGGPGVSEFQIAYASADVVYYLGVPIDPLGPTAQAADRVYSITPPLPAGLELDPDTGIISGEATGTAPKRRYTVTAAVGAVEATAEVTLGVVFPPRFALVANQEDSTISSYAIDPATGLLRHRGYTSAPDTATGPADLLMHPSGDYFFAVNHESRTLTVYGLSSVDGSVTPLSTIGQGTSPNEMAVHPNGRFLYVTSLFSSQIRMYEFDEVAGTLTSIGTPVQATPVIADIAIHPTGDFLSVTNRTDGIVQSFSLDQATGLITGLLNTAPVNSLASSIAFSADGLYAYLTAQNFQLLVRFQVDPATGEFFNPRTKPTGLDPLQVKLHPCGKFLYVVNEGSNTLTKYVINPANGIPLPPTIVPTGLAPQSISFDPAGNYAYVMNGAAADMTVYRVDLADGRLTIVEDMPARARPRALVMVQGPLPVVDEAQFVYVANQESGDVSSFRVDGATGELELIGLAPLAGDSPTDVVADQDGRFVYVANSGSDDITCFALNGATGALTQIGPNVPAGLGTNALAIEASGRFLYATARDAGTVSAFRIDQGTGTLSLLETEATTDSNPVSAEVDPTGRFLYVANAGTPGDPAHPGDVSTYAIDPRFGTLTPHGGGSGVQGGSPSAITFGRSGRIAYVPLSTMQGFVAATVHFEDGSLAPDVQDVGTADRSLAIDVDPSGQFAYAAVEGALPGSNRVEVYGLGIDGEMTLLSSTLDGASPSDLEVGPSGRFLYTANRDADDVSVFGLSRIDGATTLVQRLPAGLQPGAIAVVGLVK